MVTTAAADLQIVKGLTYFPAFGTLDCVLPVPVQATIDVARR